MKKLVLCLCLVCVSCIACFAQTDQDKQKAISDFRFKIHQLEIYNMVLPVLLKKDQIRSILKEVEKIREKRREILDAQYKLMRQLQNGVDDALVAASTRGAIPGQQLVGQLYKATQATLIELSLWSSEATDLIYTTVTATLDKGQQTVMAKTLNPRDFPDQLKKPEEVSQADRIKIFIRNVFLDPDAYDILVKMSI